MITNTCPHCGAPQKIDPTRTKSVDPDSTRGKILFFIYGKDWVSKTLVLKTLGRPRNIMDERPSKPNLHMAFKTLRAEGLLEEKNGFLKIPEEIIIISER